MTNDMWPNWLMPNVERASEVIAQLRARALRVITRDQNDNEDIDERDEQS